MSTVQRITKNIAITGFSQLLISVSGFLLVIYIARYLGKADFGKFNFALYFSTFFLIIADPGISSFIIREIARNKELTNEYVTNASLIKSILLLITFFTIVVSINLMGYPQDTKLIVYLFGTYTLLTSFSLTFRAVYQAFEKMQCTAVLDIAKQLILIISVSFVIYSNRSLLELAYCYVLTGIVDVLLNVIFLKKVEHIEPKFNLALWKPMIIKAFPFGLNSFFAVFFFKIDTFMLSVIKGYVEVGIYSAAYTPLLALSTVTSNMITTAIYPVMSKNFVHLKNSLEFMTAYSSKYIMIIGLPISIGCFTLANQFINLFYGDQYSESVIAFQILALFIPLRLISGITGTLLTSIDKQNIRTFSVGICAAINIILNIILIPNLGFIGAAVSTVVSELCLYIIFLIYIQKYYKKININQYFTKPFVASLLMGLFITLTPELNLYLLVMISAIVYIIALLFLGTFDQEDKKIFKQIFKSV
ncbi:MAG: flippase [Methanosarcina barkeri]|nr:flippase [Methanosarcina sp. ERenArc_MAG2]